MSDRLPPPPSQGPNPGTPPPGWSAPPASAGPQGPHGPGGPVGPHGPQSPAGPYGPQGPNGPYGPGGPSGPGGPQGPGGQGWPPPSGGPGGPQGPGDSSGKKRGLLIGGLSGAGALVMALLLLLVGLPALGYTPLGDPFGLAKTEAEAAEGVAGDVDYYVGVDLDPNAKQKIDAFRLMQNFPELEGFWAETFGAPPSEDVDLRREVVELALADADCGLTYDEDISPWVGSTVAVGGYLTSDEPSAFVSVQVTDTAAAEEAASKLLQCGGGSVGIAFAGDYMIVTDDSSKAEVDEYAAAVESDPLSSNGEFTSDIEALGELGIFTYWGQSNLESMDMGSAGPQSVGERGAGTVIFRPDGLELKGAFYAPNDLGDLPDNNLASMPESTAVGVSLSGGSEIVGEYWDEAMAQLDALEPGTSDEIAQVASRSGFSLPGDVQTFMGDTFTVAVDGATDWQAADDDPSAVKGALVVTGDGTAINELYGRLEAMIRQEDPEFPLVKREIEDGIVVALAEDYADQVVAEESTLGDSEAFRSVLPDAESQDFAAYVNLDAMEGLYLPEMESDEDVHPVVYESLERLQAVGLQANVEGDYVVSSITVSIN